MKTGKYILVFLLSFLVLAPIMAVETVIVGEVRDETTGDPIPNVNIHFRGTKIGTTSDKSGAYALRVDMTAKSQLVFSAVGYYTQRYDIEPGVMSGLQVTMREKSAVLTEVVVAPHENPALGILRQVRAHRAEHDRTMHPEWTEKVEREQTLYISHIRKRHLRRALWRSLQTGMMAQDDSTYILPLYRETQSFRLSGSEMIPANDQRTEALILSTTDYSALIGGEGNLNFYANSVSLMNQSFLSPLASNGNLYYRYYIDEWTTKDSLLAINFRTRNPFYATFNGQMLIDTATFALRAISAYVPAEVAVNYVNNLHVVQVLGKDDRLDKEHISVLLDVAIKTELNNKPFPTLLLTTSLTNPEASTMPEVEMPTQQRFDVNRIVAATDSLWTKLKATPVMRTASWVASIISTGYIPTGTAIDIGHIEEILQVNNDEGVHFGLPFRTNEKLCKWFSMEASVGYGIRDRSAKGMGRLSFDLPTPRKNILQLEYNNRYVWSEVDDFDRLLRENSMGWGFMDFTAYAFESIHRDSLYVNTRIRSQQIQLHWFADWSPNVETHAYARVGWLAGLPYQSLSGIVRLSWGERKYDGYFMRRYAYSSRYPVLFLGAEANHWEEGVFAHLRLMLTHHANLGMGGKLTYALQTGTLLGRIPHVMLAQMNANQGYAYDPYRFSFLHGGQMMADKYVTLQGEWNGMGILFNLIPGIRWMHMRELVEGKVAYTHLSAKNATETEYKSGSQWYTEVGVGIGNILRICDVYSIWSITPKVEWTMRFRIHLSL